MTFIEVILYQLRVGLINPDWVSGTMTARNLPAELINHTD